MHSSMYVTYIVRLGNSPCEPINKTTGAATLRGESAGIFRREKKYKTLKAFQNRCLIQDSPPKDSACVDTLKSKPCIFLHNLLERTHSSKKSAP